jgi:DNA-binding Xre family transcriptional regulator
VGYRLQKFWSYLEHSSQESLESGLANKIYSRIELLFANLFYFGIFYYGIQHRSMMLNKDRKRLLRETLKNTRIEKGLRQVDLAEALGRTQSYVAKLEAGEKNLDFIEVLEICKVLRLNPMALIKALM